MVLTWLCSTLTAELLGRPSRPSVLGLAVPVLYFALAFIATTSGPAGGTMSEGAALLGALVVCALARQGLVEAGTVKAGTGRSAARAGPAPQLLTARGSGGGHGGRDAGGVDRRGGRRTRAGGQAGERQPPDAAAFGHGRRPPRRSGRAAQRDPGAAPRDVFEVQVQSAWSGYIPLAVLDQYNGDAWSFSATFRPTGGRVPSPATLAASDPEAEQLLQRYRLEGATGLPFLPAMDRPTQVDGVAADADTTTGMLAASITVPASYTVVSLVPPGTIGQLSSAGGLAAGAEVPGGGAPAFTTLPVGSAPDIAAAVRFASVLAGRPAAASLAFLQSFTVALRAQERRVTEAGNTSGGQSVAAALGGTSLAQVMNAVTVDRAATPEQFATFFAVVARYLGVPVRLATGFRVPAAATTSGPLPPGSYQLTDRDAWTWDEVPVLGYGWVTVDPTPVRTTANVAPPPEQVTASPTTVPRQVTALPGGGAAHAIAKPVNVKLARPLNMNWPLVIGAGLPSALVLALLAGGLGLPAVRRRLRRRRGTKRATPSS